MEDMEEKPHVCSSCYEIFDTADILENHKEACLERKPFVCQNCQMTFEEESELVQHHLEQHLKRNENECQAQEKEKYVKIKEDLDEEEESESCGKTNLFICHICNVTFQEESYRIKHISEQHHSSVIKIDPEKIHCYHLYRPQ